MVDLLVAEQTYHGGWDVGMLLKLAYRNRFVVYDTSCTWQMKSSLQTELLMLCSQSPQLVHSKSSVVSLSSSCKNTPQHHGSYF